MDDPTNIVLPYFNFYVSDYLSYGRRLSDSEVREILDAICDICTYGTTSYEPSTKYQRAFFNVLIHNVQRSMRCYLTRIENGRKHVKKEKPDG